MEKKIEEERKEADKKKHDVMEAKRRQGEQEKQKQEQAQARNEQVRCHFLNTIKNKLTHIHHNTVFNSTFRISLFWGE